MIVRFHGMRSGRSSSQVNAGSMTTHFGHAAGAVVGIGLEVLARAADLVGEQRVAPPDRARDRLRVRVDQQLGGVEAIAVLRIVRSVDAIAVELSGAHVGQIAVPDLIGALAQSDRVRFDVVVFVLEQAELDAGRVLGEDREVDALAVPCGTERIRLAGPDAHVFSSGSEVVVIPSEARDLVPARNATSREAVSVRNKPDPSLSLGMTADARGRQCRRRLLILPKRMNDGRSRQLRDSSARP